MKIVDSKSAATCPLCHKPRGSGHCRHFVCIEGPEPGSSTFNIRPYTSPEFWDMPTNGRVLITSSQVDEDSDAVFYWMDYEQSGMEDVAREKFTKAELQFFNDVLDATATLMDSVIDEAFEEDPDSEVGEEPGPVAIPAEVYKGLNEATCESLDKSVAATLSSTMDNAIKGLGLEPVNVWVCSCGAEEPFSESSCPDSLSQCSLCKQVGRFIKKVAS